IRGTCFFHESRYTPSRMCSLTRIKHSPHSTHLASRSDTVRCETIGEISRTGALQAPCCGFKPPLRGVGCHSSTFATPNTTARTAILSAHSKPLQHHEHRRQKRRRSNHYHCPGHMKHLRQCHFPFLS